MLGYPALRGRSYQSQDAVYTLTCAIIVLNTNLHNKSPAAEDVRWSLSSLDKPIEWIQDDSGAESVLLSPNLQTLPSATFLSLPDPETSADYK